MEKDHIKSEWKYLISVNLDLVIAIIFTLFLYALELFLRKGFMFKDYGFLSTIFLVVFSVNFTVFALSKFLIENYPKIKEERIKKNIDIIFRVPIKISMIGLIISVIFYVLNLNVLTYFNFILYFLFFYSIIASYYVFKFLYEISIKKGNS
ncbi:hypothetical protein HYW75_03075 [Candidatus Pacearchaeota archaeon]|nr:hypothetical protein [Candidatus Pacearchaeota archaeon]